MEKRSAVLPTVRVTKFVAKQLKLIATQEGRTRSGLIARILESVAKTGAYPMPEGK